MTAVFLFIWCNVHCAAFT